MSLDNLSQTISSTCSNSTRCGGGGDQNKNASQNGGRNFFEHGMEPTRDSLLGDEEQNADCLDKCVELTYKLEKNCPMSCENSKAERRSFCCSTISQCTWGVLLLLMSIGGFIFTPLDFMLWEKLNMRPGFPPYEWWADPPDELKLRVYVFNVTNHERFLQGLDAKVNLQEIGPIVYLEKLQHSNIKFNENGTMTYTAKRTPIFLPDDNFVDLNATIVVPNLAVLGIASYLHDAPYFARIGFRFLVNSYRSQFFVKKTIYEYLWSFGDPVLDMSKNLAPGLVPVSNMGMLARIYSDFTDEMSVFVGPQWGDDKFFQITRFRGQPQLPGYDPDTCPDRIFGSTEGVMYKQRIKKTDSLLYWRKTVCKIMPLYFDAAITVDSVPVYRFNLSERVFDRVSNGTDCYDTTPSLPDGLSDGSKCYFDFPMVISYPHFYTGSPAPHTYVTGLKPDRYKHNSYVIVEPLSGTPFRSVARMQSNLLIRDLSAFPAEYHRFSHTVLPMFWAEYNQEGLPSHIKLTIYFMTVILPPLSTVLLTTILLSSCYILARLFYINKLKSDSLKVALPFRKTQVNQIASARFFTFEKEKFLSRDS